MVESKRVRTLKEKARKESIKEGIFASARLSFGDRYIQPFAIAINASNPIVALLGSIGGLLGPLSQLRGSRKIEKKPRKKIVTRAVLLESLSWLLFISIGILFYFNIITEILPLAILFSFAIFTLLANFAVPAWFSWVGDIVDEEYRGRWFSKRNLLTGFFSIILSIIAAVSLDFFKKNNWTIWGFLLLFSLAMTFRLLSWKAFKRQYEPKIKLEKGYYFTFWQFIKNAPKNNFGRFAIFRGCLAFSISITSTLIAIYLLRYLNFSYVLYMTVTLVGTGLSLLLLELWGKIADIYGNYKVIAMTMVITPIIPILWILGHTPIYLLLIPSFLGAVAWDGFVLASGNLIYDNVSPQKRGIAISYLNLLIGIGIFLGAGLGALLIGILNLSFIEPIVAIFIIGSLARMLVVYIFLPKFKEIRKTKNPKPKEIEKMIFKEVKPTIVEETHQLISVKKYFSQ